MNIMSTVGAHLEKIIYPNPVELLGSTLDPGSYKLVTFKPLGNANQLAYRASLQRVAKFTAATK